METIDILIESISQKLEETSSIRHFSPILYFRAEIVSDQVVPDPDDTIKTEMIFC